MNKPEAGQVYRAFREDIYDPKEKYHLYLADDIVFLINSDPNLFDFDICLEASDAEILTKKCYLQIKQLYRYDCSYPVIRISEMSTRILRTLCAQLKDKNITKKIPRIYINRAIGIIELCISNRQEQDLK